MTDLEFIIKACKKAHFTGWEQDVLEECKERLDSLNREQLRSLLTFRYLEGKDPLRVAVFEKMFAEQLGQREQRIREAPTKELADEFIKEKRGGNIALIRQVLQERYLEGQDREEIERAFANGSKKDQQWIQSH